MSHSWPKGETLPCLMAGPKVKHCHVSQLDQRQNTAMSHSWPTGKTLLCVSQLAQRNNCHVSQLAERKSTAMCLTVGPKKKLPCLTAGPKEKHCHISQLAQQLLTAYLILFFGWGKHWPLMLNIKEVVCATQASYDSCCCLKLGSPAILSWMKLVLWAQSTTQGYTRAKV